MGKSHTTAAIRLDWTGRLPPSSLQALWQHNTNVVESFVKCWLEVGLYSCQPRLLDFNRATTMRQNEYE